ncbi:MAG: hypothetical protein JW982_11805 [Spirochaetes bacterium]|nr:hypothetical protein [Spirochaetota bacterium]
MKKIIILVITFLFIIPVSAVDYQYQYFNNEKNEERYLPFSDYIPRVRKYNMTHPQQVEDFYLLYGMPLYYNENDLRENIRLLKIALTVNFRHPTKALCRITTEQEYYKYRNLMFMRINVLIMRDYMRIASQYDKRDVYFYDVHYEEDLIKSFAIAEENYRAAIPYWEQALKYAKTASTVKLTTDLGSIESERYSFVTGEIDYRKIINGHLSRLEKKKSKLASFRKPAN